MLLRQTYTNTHTHACIPAQHENRVLYRKMLKQLLKEKVVCYLLHADQNGHGIKRWPTHALVYKWEQKRALYSFNMNNSDLPPNMTHIRVTIREVHGVRVLTGGELCAFEALMLGSGVSLVLDDFSLTHRAWQHPHLTCHFLHLSCCLPCFTVCRKLQQSAS